jgi:hypothetical protein
MTRILSRGVVTLLFAICITKPAAAACVAKEWTNERDDRPIWQCSGLSSQ